MKSGRVACHALQQFAWPLQSTVLLPPQITILTDVSRQWRKEARERCVSMSGPSNVSSIKYEVLKRSHDAFRPLLKNNTIHESDKTAQNGSFNSSSFVRFRGSLCCFLAAHTFEQAASVLTQEFFQQIASSLLHSPVGSRCL